MDANAVMLIGAGMLAIGVMLFLILPMLRGESASFARRPEELTDAQARKKATLRALRDVELDYETGKLDSDDYKELKTALSRDALHAMRRVEAEVPGAAAVAAAPTRSAGSIEEEIARAREGLRDGRTCATCGHVNVEESRFCSSCGGTLSPGAPAE